VGNTITPTRPPCAADTSGRSTEVAVTWQMSACLAQEHRRPVVLRHPQGFQLSLQVRGGGCPPTLPDYQIHLKP
jgi:hypothetical protein